LSIAALPIPRHAKIPGFLPSEELQALLDWTISSRDDFRPAKVSPSSGRVDPERRIALTTRKFGMLEEVLRKRLLDVLPELMNSTGTGGSMPTLLELELAAHGDGAHFAPHIDTFVGESRRKVDAGSGADRVLSAVLYFHAEPKAFSGGELRLYSFGAIPEASDEERRHLDLQPMQNTLVAFPSWAPHAVRPISCASGLFVNYRFAVNCWYCRGQALPSSE
jgi:Rps23 Pro-64 3,4-dihydroxylase Tpa1-like proline 4-hydroxylase